MDIQKQKIISDQNTKESLKMTPNKIVALIIGIVLLTFLVGSLINDLIFYDTYDFNSGQSLLFKHNKSKEEWAIFKDKFIWQFLMRFTYLTVHINLLASVSLINYALNKKYQLSARRFLNFAFTYLVFGVILYWGFVSFRLTERFTGRLKWYNYFHVYLSHLIMPIFAFVGFLFAKNDLIMWKRDIAWSTFYVAGYIFFYFVMYTTLFVKAFNGYKPEPGLTSDQIYLKRMEAGNAATTFLYDFLHFAKPLFSENPYKGFSHTLIWTKAILIDIILVAFLISISPLLMFTFKYLFKIKMLKTKEEYLEYKKILKENWNAKPILAIAY